MAAAGATVDGAGPVVLVSSCKGEKFNLRSGYKQLARHLRSARCDVRRLDAAGGAPAITPAVLNQAAIVVFGGPTQPFTAQELEHLRDFVHGGGNLLVLGGEGGEVAASTHLNELLAGFGLRLAADCVIQTAFTRYMHPKQVLVSEGLLSPEMAAYCASNSKARRGAGNGAAGAGGARASDENGRPLASFVFPDGATVVAQAPAVPILSSGLVAHPCNMAIGAVWWQDSGGAGRVAALGSAAMFGDEWLGKEDNAPLLDFLLGWMLRDPACALNSRTIAEPEILDPRPVTHMAELAAQPRVCLQEHAELPLDITRMFADKLFRLDTSLVPQVAALRRELGAEAALRRRQLPLWTPPLEVPFPPLQPAIFPPAFRELPPPALELFDLEEELAGPLERLNNVTAAFLAAHRSGGAAPPLQAYVHDCARLLGLRSAAGAGADPAAAKRQLAEVLEAVVQCKMPDRGAGLGY